MSQEIEKKESMPQGDQALGKILRSTIETIENSKSQIFDVYEYARGEVDSCQKTLEEIKALTAQTITIVDDLEKREQEEKQKLVRVSSNFADYSEARIKASYDAVKNVQVKLGIAREKEADLRRKRDRIEIKLQSLRKTLAASERLAMRIGAVLGYLSSSIGDIVAQMEAASKNVMLGAQIIRAQEEERFRVSREIHDGPAQDMANLIFQSSICERMIDIDPDETKRGLQELRRQIRGCLTDIRQIIFDMRPMSLDDLGLIPALKQLLLKMKEREILEVSMHVEGPEVDLPKHVEVGIFRIVQESLNNVKRHANTKKAKVRVLFTNSHLSILVVDSGSGFDMEEAEELAKEAGGDGHFGLLGMRERAKIIGADLSVVSSLGKGTRVHLKLPLKTEATQPSTVVAKNKE